MMRARPFRGRKAMIFNITLVILSVIVLVYAYIQISSKQDKVEDEIGKQSMDLIVKMQEGEKALIFLDFAAKMAVYEAIYSLQSSGGISNTGTCGTYYGFNRWNSNTGKTCFVDSSTAKDALRDLFVSNLVARVASYPSADFVGNVPSAAFSRGVSMTGQQQVSASSSAAAATTQAASSSCSGQKEFMKDFTYTSQSGFFPKDGSRVWIPAEANCQGSYPLVIWLHGCQKSTSATLHVRFGDGHKEDLIPLARKLVSGGKVKPVILAAPSQTLGTDTYYSIPNSACTSSLWGSYFDIQTFIDLVKQQLPSGISISSVSVMGHSGAGCSSAGGIHAAAQKLPNAKVIGQFDTCTSSGFGLSLRKKLGADTKFIAIYSKMGDKREEQNRAMGITKKISCPSTELSGGDMEECYSDASGKYVGYALKDSNNHGLAATVGAEQLLKSVFPGSAG